MWWQCGYLQYLTALRTFGQHGTRLPVVLIKLGGVSMADPITERTATEMFNTQTLEVLNNQDTHYRVQFTSHCRSLRRSPNWNSSWSRHHFPTPEIQPYCRRSSFWVDSASAPSHCSSASHSRNFRIYPHWPNGDDRSHGRSCSWWFQPNLVVSPDSSGNPAISVNWNLTAN